MRRFASQFVSNRKVVGNLVTNVAGLQVIRILFFRLALILGRWRHALVLPQRVAALKRDGVVLIADYLPAREFEEIRSVFYRIIADNGQAPHKKYARDDRIDIASVTISREACEKYPILRRIFDSPELVAAFSHLAGKPVAIGAIGAELIKHRSGETDPETALHADTFFPSQNAWLFVEDCDVAAGPFVYACRSHRLTPARLLFQYLVSLRFFFGESGSPRLSPRFARLLKVQPEPVAVRRNTLAISNNFGFHARGVGRNGTIRAGFKLSLKETPFSRTRSEVADG